MSDVAVMGLSAAGFAVVAVALAWRAGIGLERSLATAALRAAVQLAAVGAVIALVFELPSLAFAFVAVMTAAAALTSGGRLAALPGARWRVLCAIALPALGATGLLLLVGAFATTPRAAVPTAGILLGGAMTAATLTGRRMIEALAEGRDEIEARLCLGDDVRTALAPSIRRAVRTGLVPAIDQTRTVGLVTLPGTFVGLVLGGASPERAAATQLVVLIALLAVELAAGLIVAELALRAVVEPGERVRAVVDR